MDTVSTPTLAWREPKVVLVLIGLLLLAGIVALAILRERLVSPAQWQVAVIGQGKVSYQPDLAIVTLGVQVDRAVYAESALKQLNDKMQKVVAALKAVQVSAEDITTQNYSLYPQYDYKDGVSTSAGYSANQQVVIKLKDIQDGSRLSQVIDQATKAGANQITGIAFDLSNLNDLKQEARLKAIADAKQKAQSQAQAAGVRLGKVIGWWENLVQGPGPTSPLAYGKGGEVGGGGTPATPQVATGTQEIIIEVSLNYKVK